MAAFVLPSMTPRSEAAELSVDDYAVIGEALHAIDMNEWPRAFRLMGSVDDPLANKLFRWISMLEEKGTADFDALATFIIDNPDWPRIDELQEQAEGKLTDSADKELTYAFYDEREPLSTRGLVRLAEAEFAYGDVGRAAEHARRAWIHGDFSAKEETAFLERHGQHLRAGDHSARLEQLLWDRQWRNAKRMLKRVSRAYAKLGQARLALQTQAPGVDGAVNAVPDDLANDPGLLFDRARWRRLKRKYEGAQELLMDSPDRLVRPERWWFERSFHIRRLIDDRAFDEAYRLASRHGQLVGGDYAEAEWLAGWLALRFIKRPKTAFRHFVRLYDRVVPPVRQARAAYWAGRAAAALHDDAGAVAWYRRAATHHTSYYGQMAIAELDGDVEIEPVASATETERAAFEAKELAAVARMLIAVGNRRYLDDVLMQLAKSAETPAEIGLITDYAHAAGRPSLLARLGRNAAFAGKVHEKSAFPIPKIKGLLEPVAAVDPSLLLGIARQESMFRRGAESSADARGLMQLIPSTARNVARRADQPYDRDRLTADHDYNALLGGLYVQTLIERFDGALPLALAGYNAGPLRVSRWIERHGDPREGDRHAMVDWIELIPFFETRNYLQRVLEGYHVYSRRLAQSDVELIDYPGINLLHPPPVPLARPSDLSDDRVARSERADASSVLRPRLKPADVIPGGDRNNTAGEKRTDSAAASVDATINGSFDAGRIQDVAAEDGDPTPEQTVPKL